MGDAANPRGTSTPHTVRSLIAATTPWLQKKGVDNPRLDAELLLCHALSLSRIQLYSDYERPLTDAEVEACRGYVARRGKHEPVAYIVGSKEFFGLSFRVTADVLVPRPATETLVEEALNRLHKDAAGLVIDVCTGSGCVALAIAHARPGVRVIACDVSAAALAVARDNAERLGLADRVSLREGDLLAPCQEERDVLLVVANPPYIKRKDASGLMPDVRDHEPALALFGDDDDGLGHHRRIVAAAPALLAAGGQVLLEIGADQGLDAATLATPGLLEVTVVNDLDGHPRVVCLKA